MLMFHSYILCTPHTISLHCIQLPLFILFGMQGCNRSINAYNQTFTMFEQCFCQNQISNIDGIIFGVRITGAV